METLIKQLERILTIDGQGRPAKARMLLEIIENEFPDDPSTELRDALKEIGERKFF